MNNESISSPNRIVIWLAGHPAIFALVFLFLGLADAFLAFKGFGRASNLFLGRWYVVPKKATKEDRIGLRFFAFLELIIPVLLLIGFLQDRYTKGSLLDIFK